MLPCLCVYACRGRLKTLVSDLTNEHIVETAAKLLRAEATRKGWKLCESSDIFHPSTTTKTDCSTTAEKTFDINYYVCGNSRKLRGRAATATKPMKERYTDM